MVSDGALPVGPIKKAPGSLRRPVASLRIWPVSKEKALSLSAEIIAYQPLRAGDRPNRIGRP